MRAVVVIPARLASTRLPRKLLLAESGRPLIHHVYERAAAASRAADVVIATDSEEIRDAARAFGAAAVMTSPDHTSGTDRVAEAIRGLDGPQPDLVVNVQGDEPELDPGLIDRLIEVMAACQDPMGTLAEPLQDPGDLERPHVVKVVCDLAGRALYFSRAPIPHARDVADAGALRPLRHVGIYAYRPAFLQEFCRLAPTALEQAERLEQLRALARGHRIRVEVIPPTGARGIDTREDYDAFLARLGAAD